MDARTPETDRQTIAARLAAGALRPRRAGAAGRRRARRLPGRRLPGAARGGPRAGLGVAACRSARSTQRIIAGNPPERRLERLRDVLGAHHRAARSGTTRRTATSSARRATRRSSMMTMMLGQPGFFKPHQIRPWFSPAGAATATSYYDTAPLRETLLELVDFDLINEQASALLGRRGERADRQLRLFRQRQGDHRAGARHGERRAAAGAADGQDRHRSFLGRRHRLQHAAAASARPGRPPELAGVPGRPVQRARRAAARHPGRDGAAQGHHVFLAHPLQHRRLSRACTNLEDAASTRRWRRSRRSS